MKIKSTVWIACLVIPLALVWLLMRSQVDRSVAAQEAERLRAVVAPADKPMVDSPARQKAGTGLSKPDAARGEPAIGSDLEPSALPDAVTDKELAIPNVDPLVVKSDDNSTPATERPIPPIGAVPEEPLTPQPFVDSGTVEYPLLGPKKRIMAPPNGIPDLTGNWTGEGWGQVELRQTKFGVYQGSYSDTFRQRPGAIALRWSAEERRYKGEWTEGEGDRLGELTVRLMSGGNVIRGAFSADAKSKINPSNPKLGDLEWTRVIPGVVINVPAMGPLPLAIPFSYKEPGAGRGSSTALRNGLQFLNRNRNEVKDEVRREFEARQKSLQNELVEFRDRIDRLAVALHERDRQKDTIIERRVDELLNPNLRWDAAGNPRGAGMMGAAAGGSTERPMPARGGGLNSASSLSGTPPASTPATGMGMRISIPQTAPRANDFRVGDSAFSFGAIDKGLEFLSQYPRFSSLSLAMTETQFRGFLEENKLVPQLSIPHDGQLNYSVPLGDGNRLTVMFGLDGKCRGIERIGGAAPSPILPHPATPAPIRAEKVVAKIFRLEQVDAASVAKTLQELAREKPFSARVSADITSNSVIVFANPDDMQVIEAVIIRLDKAPESRSPKAAPKSSDVSSPADEASGTSNTAKPSSTQVANELKPWQGRWLLVSAEINGKEQKRDEVSTQSITVSGSALKIGVRQLETKGDLIVNGVLKVVSTFGETTAFSTLDGTKAFIFETPSGQVTRREFETVDGVTRAKEISYELPIPLTGIYEFPKGKLVLCFYDQGSKDTPKRPDKFQTTPDSDLHLYIFDKVAEPDAAAPAGEAGSPSK